MKTLRQFFAVPLALALTLGVMAPAFVVTSAGAQSQQPYGALERGYRTGYSDGYQAGWNDQVKRRQADYRSKAEYRQADRAYVAAYGQLEDYRDGYQQGFEVGYGAGYSRRGFDSDLPPGGVARRGADAGVDGGTSDASGGVRDDESAGSQSGVGAADPRYESASAGDYNSIPADTLLTIELISRLSTDVSQRGDRFEARVVEPQPFAGLIVAGRLTDVQRPGKTRGRALLQLDFEQAKQADGQWAEFHAQVVEVVVFDEDASLEVDPEGGIRGSDSTRDDVAKVGASAGIGAIIGGIAGGGKGAGIGAIIGAGAGTAGVMNQRGKEIRLEPGQQLKIRVAGRVR
jgi:hypothetical protein